MLTACVIFNLQCLMMLCYSPTLSELLPRLTSPSAGLPVNYRKDVWTNRMQYAARHKYKYCELQMTDRNKIPAFR